MKNNQYSNFNLSNDSQKDDKALLTYIVDNYDRLKTEDPENLAELLANFAEHLIDIGMSETFILNWINHALEFNQNNVRARVLLITLKWKTHENELDFLSFPPIRESDNPAARKSTIVHYKQVCEQFLNEYDELLVTLQNDLKFLHNTEGQYHLEHRYSKLITIYGELSEEIIQFLKLLNDYEEGASRTFYNTKSFSEIKQTVARLNDYKNQWIELFLEPDINNKDHSALQELNNMIGLSDVKSRIESLYSFLKYQKIRSSHGFQSKDKHSLNMILLGNPGTGKTTIARLLAKIYHELGILPSEEVIETNRSQLVGSFVGQTEENVRMIVEKAVGGVLFIDEAYSLKREGQSGSDYGQTAVDTLVSLMTSKEYGGKFSVVLAGYPEEMRQFLDGNPGLRSRFPASNIINLPDYTTDELLEIGDTIARANDYLITEDGKKELAYRIEQERVDDSFGNARTVQNIITQAIFEKGKKHSETMANLFAFSVLDKEDFQQEKEGNNETSPMEELNKLIGLSEIKETVQTLISFVKMQTYRRDLDYPHVPIQLHSVFTGNPGTGKTTVAKIYAKLLKECGMLKRGHLVVVGRADLIAGYVGQSAIKTRKKIREALGGVLFIDEAYSLFRGNNSDYGKEVVDTLVEEMTKHGENLVVVLAGYPSEMELLLDSNPGLKSRFKKFFRFPDYSVQELIEIMVFYAKKYAYELDDNALQYMNDELSHNFPKGNGRFAENIIHEAIQQQALRLIQEDGFSEKEVNVITKEDLSAAFEILKKGE